MTKAPYDTGSMVGLFVKVLASILTKVTVVRYLARAMRVELGVGSLLCHEGRD